MKIKQENCKLTEKERYEIGNGIHGIHDVIFHDEKIKKIVVKLIIVFPGQLSCNGYIEKDVIGK